MNIDKKNLLAKAKQVLEENWKGMHTVPSSYLYPHQWSWDSAFISIGLSRYNQKRAQQEILSMFEGQWKNGMLPHIIFRSKESYFPGPKYWEINRSEYAPNISTSGITQPPVHAIAALKIYENVTDKAKAIDFLKKMYPKFLAFHRYLLTSRDPEKSGLITIIHPWESGIDNSIRWDEAMAKIKVHDVPKYERIDNKKVNANQRPTDEDYDKFVFLIEILKKENYNIEELYEKYPFKIKDILFSSILYVANKALLDIVDIIGEEKDEILQWMKRTQDNYLSYFCSGKGDNKLVYDYDLIEKKRIERRAAASFLALYTGLINQLQAKNMVEWMKHSHMCTAVSCTHHHPVITTTSITDSEFNPLNYWRGPIWININWMLYQGLRFYKLNDDAEQLRNALLELVNEHGFYEYYNPLTSQGLGADNFSWTAALTIDLLYEEKQ